MALPHHYLMALISPLGRISQYPFAVLCVLLAFAHVYIYGEIQRHDPSEPWNAFTITLFVMLWMKFCLVSRRMHDTGSNGFFVIPVFLFAVAVFLISVDPDLAGDSFVNDEGWGFIRDNAARMVRMAFIGFFVYCIRAPSDEGPNAYGPEFGDPPGDARLDAGALERLEAGQLPNNVYGRPDSSGTASWGERARPRGFGRR